MRAIFEKYPESDTVPNGLSGKLLELVCRDLDVLQNQYITRSE